jgi:plasmid stabilization system protein ParE
VGNLRELVISKGRTGYVALYRYLPEQDRVDVLAIRHQRESGLMD